MQLQKDFMAPICRKCRERTSKTERRQEKTTKVWPFSCPKMFKQGTKLDFSSLEENCSRKEAIRMQTMVAPIEEDLPTMTMPDCCLEPVYNWNFMCLPRKKLVKRVGISLYYMLTAWFSQDYHFIRVCLLFLQFLIKKKTRD